MDAPSPEDKLSWLSDIAQEHSVEWDAHAAALEMLPAEKQSGFSPSFSSGPPGAGGGSSFGQGPPGNGHYQTPQRPPLQPAPANNAPFLPQPGPSASKRHQLLQIAESLVPERVLCSRVCDRTSMQHKLTLINSPGVRPETESSLPFAKIVISRNSSLLWKGQQCE